MLTSFAVGNEDLLFSDLTIGDSYFIAVGFSVPPKLANPLAFKICVISDTWSFFEGNCDLNFDEDLNTDDLLVFLSGFGSYEHAYGDFNMNYMIDVFDLLEMMGCF